MTKSQQQPSSAETSPAEKLATAEKLTPEILAEAAETDRTDSFPAKTFEKLRETNLLYTILPQKFGGEGLGIENSTTAELLSLLKILGYGNLVVARIFEGHFNAVQLVNQYASQSQAERIFSEAKRGKHLFGVWNTEAGNGIKIDALENGKLRLSGAKTFASGIGHVNRPIITGRLSGGGWQMFLLPLDKVQSEVDDSWWNPLGMQSSRSYRIDLTGVEITADELIGQPNDYYREPLFSGGAIRFAAAQLGAAEFLFDSARNFLREIHRTGDNFQQMRFGEMAIAIESGNSFIKNSARIFDEYLAEQNAEKLAKTLNYAAMTRTSIEQMCQDIMLRVTRSIGSRGLMKNYHFERVIRDLMMYLRQAAPDAALVNLGKYVLENELPVRNLWTKENE